MLEIHGDANNNRKRNLSYGHRNKCQQKVNFPLEKMKKRLNLKKELMKKLLQYFQYNI